jgi:hypothetical protein
MERYFSDICECGLTFSMQYHHAGDHFMLSCPKAISVCGSHLPVGWFTDYLFVKYHNGICG